MLSYSNKKILVTGAAGFIGYHLVSRLISEKTEIIGLDNINNYYDINLKYGRLNETGIQKEEIEYSKKIKSSRYQNYSFIQLNLEDKEQIDKLFKEEHFDYVVNLAAQAGVRYSIENPYAYLESNIHGFLNILEACRHNKIKHLVYASSSSVYGKNEKLPFAETDFVDNPISLYAASKKSNELMAHTYSHLFNIPTTGLRFFTVYGPWGRPDMALFLFTKAILEGREIEVFNNGNMQRDFTYIDDIIQGIYNVTLRPETENGVYQLFNIGNNSPENLLHFIETIEKEIGREAVKVLKPMQAGDVKATYADTKRLEKRADFKPNTPIEKGIHEFVKWYRWFYKV